MLFLAAVALQARAIEIDTGNDDVVMRFDNTLKQSLAWRVKSADPALLANPNDDDGDRNFAQGLVSNRTDLFSEFEAGYKRQVGLRLSGAAWYDSVYNKSDANPGFAGGAYPNQTLEAYNQFPEATRVDMGRDALILDAFAYGKFDLAGHSATLRVGQHSQLWGESLFFAANAIAGGQQPVDVVKLLAVPGTQFKEAILPVPQVSGQLQVNANVTVGAYVQTKFRPDRVAPVGSYLSNVDFAVDGGESVLLGPGVPPAARGPDLRPRNGGQGGLELRLRTDEVDYGLYAIRFDDKTPQFIPVLGLSPVGPIPTSYYLAYQQGITAYGASASRTLDNVNIAIEASIHHNQDLASTQGVDISAFTPAPPTNNTSNPGYAVGNTAHVNLSTISSFGPGLFWHEATLVAELAWNRVLGITKNAAAKDPNATRDGTALRFVLEPTYRQVLDGLDIGVPFGAGYAPGGSRPLAVNNPGAWIPENGGDLSLGLHFSYRDAWRATLNYTHYYGKAEPLNLVNESNAFSWQQTLADRDFVSASVSYSF